MKKKALLLISGGIDSPVAGKLAQEKNYELEAIHFTQEPFTDDTPKQKSLQLTTKLGLKELIIVNVGKEYSTIAQTTYPEYYFILIKILMMRIAQRVAEEKKIGYLITGESAGQVSSQTISNLNSINKSVRIQILRPLFFLNKQEIVDLSKKQGYYETSKGAEMCDVLARGKPKTKSSLEEVLIEEEKCGMSELVKSALKKIEFVKTN